MGQKSVDCAFLIPKSCQEAGCRGQKSAPYAQRVVDSFRSPILGLPGSLTNLGRCLVMGVVNVTPDSFSDGGAFLATADAEARGAALHAGGADLVDVGGESTRPGAQRIPLEVELERVIPVVRGLTVQGIAVSIDTMRSEVAWRAVDAGAVLVNDVSGGLADPQMLPYLARSGVPCVFMHWRGHSVGMQERASYPRGVVTEVVAELTQRLFAASDAGMDSRQIILDPGLGFAKESEHNWQLLRGLDRLHELGRPLLVGASRKRFLGALLSGPGDEPREMSKRDDATAAISALAAHSGVWCLRVHESSANADAVRVAAAWRKDPS